uniref:Plastid-encoded RNA polymerase subunit alpha n=1 Tax=Codium arenicola TaxID=1191365 RepID=A0A2P0QHZ4_9CHLO|nr:RNA polymerase a-subunit [Codium arenicola]ARO74352.1 RNA polymerase a-subunit [Codium arenicola]
MMKFPKLIFSCLETQILKNQNTNHLAHFSASFQLGFLPAQQGLTIANALRRTLLLQTMHYSIAGVFIENIKHEYCCIKGIHESVLDLLLNLEKIIFSSSKLHTKTQFVSLFVQGPKIVRAKDIPLPSFLYCINPDQYIATLDTNAILKMTCLINNFENHSCVETTTHFYTKLYTQFVQPQINKSNLKIQNTNFLFLDSKIAPILNVNYTIQKNVLNQEIIHFTICTNGSIHPSYLLHKSIKNLILCLIPYYNINHSLQIYKWPNGRKKNKILLSKKFFKKLLCIDLANFHLSHQTYRTLHKLNIFTFGDLYKFSFKSSKNFQESYNFEYKELQTFLLKLKLYIQNL